MDNASGAPRLMSLHLLEEITNNFSEDRKLGAGAYGDVYKGVHEDGETIAVKVLHYIPELDDNQFKKEYLNLASLQHKNIVRLVGYCYETQRECLLYDGKMVFAERTKTALCFEYMHKGSLDNCLSDESEGLDWHTRYGIIKGICEGLKYLHEELESPMYHLDLKPANVLLDENMMPKIADFGLSRLFGGEQSKMTKSVIGTRGYIPPEYIDASIISIKFDIYSLGVVIIKIMTGRDGYVRSAEMSAEQFIELVHAKWRNRLRATSMYTLESYSEQVKRCIEIALSCIEADRRKRPSIGVIVKKLCETTRKRTKMDNASTVPRLMSLHLLEEITNNFSDDRKLGAGAYGNVYKGVHKDGETIAVKVLHYTPGLDDEQFEKEYLKLASLQHKNVVRLVGYCLETKRECLPYNGKMVFADITKRALCFEYMHNGSLDNWLSDESEGLDWHMRYGIIKGICEGLKYLHEELEPPMYHLDLKPANVLLDKNMMPKIADFGLLRLLRGQSEMTKSFIGTPGYIPPEYIDAAIITIKFDIYSLGAVIIEIMAGREGYFRSAEMSSEQFIELVHAKWRNRLRATSIYALESYSEQVKICIEIALSCVQADRRKRPSIGVIVNKLSETAGQSNCVDNAGVAPRLMSLHLLEEITNHFSEDRKLRVGAYGNVYKGVHKDGETIAVKVLRYIPGLDDDQFEKEYVNLASLQHKNIVRLVGYCYETQRECLPYDGKMVFAEMTKTALCFKYMHNGSLDNFISDEANGLEWQTRYGIIKGICEGVKYLHEELKSPMCHLNLKPANVLLDYNMVPKIVDFGFSRFFSGEQTEITEKSAVGTLGYVPPEYTDAAIISLKFDIYSLGVVIINIVTGQEGYFRSAEMSSERFIELVHAKWRNRLQATSMYMLESYSAQVKRCIEIALSCVQANRWKRPSIGVIVNKLGETARGKSMPL